MAILIMKSNTITKSKYKIVLLGDQHVGKTAIINRFINNIYDQTYNATIGIDFLVKNISYADKHYRIQLWDTAGQQRFKSLIPSYLKDSSCCVIVYDVTNHQSFLNAFKWLQLYNQHKNIKAISVLVGNKIDLQQRQTKPELIEQKIKSYKLKHHLVSAKQGTGVSEAFESIVSQLDNHLLSIAVNNRADQGDKQEQIKTGQALVKQNEIKFHLQQKAEVVQTKRNCCI